MQTPTPVACRKGRHVWLYPKRGVLNPTAGWPDAGRVADDLRSLGVTGVLPHEVLAGARKWLTEPRLRAFRDAGLEVCPSIGSRGPSKWEAFADEMVAWLQRVLADIKRGKTPDVTGAMWDWEIAWDHAQDEGRLVAERVRAAFSDADWALLEDCLLDCPWWAPLFLINAKGNKVNTHPGAPTAQFGRVCRRRMVQAYGATAGEGASWRFLQWARHASQYPALGTPAENVIGAHQGYRRSLQDQVKTLLEPLVLVWQWTELDATCRKALLVVKALEELGFTGQEAIRAFQRAEGLTADGILGPKTLGALGAHGKVVEAREPSRLVALVTPTPTHEADADARLMLAA